MLNGDQLKQKRQSKQQKHDVNHFVFKKEFFGLCDRFPPGRAWYHHVHSAGQVGSLLENEARFYKKTPSRK